MTEKELEKLAINMQQLQKSEGWMYIEKELQKMIDEMMLELSQVDPTGPLNYEELGKQRMHHALIIDFAKSLMNIPDKIIDATRKQKVKDFRFHLDPYYKTEDIG